VGPLEGIKILDLSFYAPARVASMYFGDLGADVIGIEMCRGNLQTSTKLRDDDCHPRWLTYQRNKKSITLNLKTEEGRNIFYRLAESVDVILEGFQPGTAKKLGIDYDSVKKVNPEIIYCSVSGFGQDGPYAHLISNEPGYQGISGTLSVTGLCDGPPVISPSLIGDVGGGAYPAMIGILSALLWKKETGKGQYIDIGVAPAVLGMNLILINYYWQRGVLPPRGNILLAGGKPNLTTYETKDGEYVVVSCLEPWVWERMCRALGKEDLIPLLRGTDKDQERLFAELQEVFASRTRDEWEEWNMKENVCVTPVLNLPEVLANPHMLHREMVADLEYSPLGMIKQIATPFKLSGTPGEVKWMPRYGEHTEQILAKLGYEEEDIRTLREKGIIE